MKKRTKILYSGVIVIALILGICIGRIRSEAKNVGIDISEKFFIQNSRDYIKNMTIYNDESVTNNGLIYTLESSVYVKKCNIGYYVISVKQENGKSDIISKGIQLNSMGGTCDEAEMQGNVMYYYFSKSAMDNEDVLEIVTSYVANPKESGIICFNLIQNESVDVKTFSNDKYKCDFSPIGYSVLHEDSEEIIEMEIAYNDGSKKTLFYYPLQDIRDGKETFDNVVICDTSSGWNYFNDTSWDTPDGMNRFTFFFNKWYDIEKIDYVSVNGEKLVIEK